MNSVQYPRLILPEGFNERSAYEANAKGWMVAQLEADDGRRYPLFFYDPVRLQQDLETYIEDGEACLAEPGMIVLPEITIEAAERAVAFLWRRGYFASLLAERSKPAPSLQFNSNTIAA